MFNNPLLLVALTITSAIAIWGIVDTASLTTLAGQLVKAQFTSRAWFIMLTVSFMLITSHLARFVQVRTHQTGQRR